MSHQSDKAPLSQPLTVEIGDANGHSDSCNIYQDKENYNPHNNNDDAESLGPLPPKWEKAYTESGEVYFIDHSSGTSHWLDPRLSKFQKKSLEDCLDDELPYGWEKISDPHYGTYFIDHVNRRTQYENPVIQAKRAQCSSSSNRVSRAASFTKDPGELCGQKLHTSLVKSSRGLGFTIVGGDDHDGVDEFLQIKSVVPKGPAWLDGKLQTGDVIVFVNDLCVLGYTHNQIVRLFQSISVGSTVSVEVCRGYPLPFDPNDPNTEVVTTIAVDSHSNQPSMLNAANDTSKRLTAALVDTNYNYVDETQLRHSSHSYHNTLTSNGDTSDLLLSKSLGSQDSDYVHVRIVKGNLGFGFTIADSACGQRVKKILDRQRCKNLMEGDILLEINECSLISMSHDDVVQVLKNCPYNSEATICVQRTLGGATGTIVGEIGSTNTGSSTSSLKSMSATRNKLLARNSKSTTGNKDILHAFRSKTPTADIYSTQTREVLPSRPKTPVIDTRNSDSKALLVTSSTSSGDMNCNAAILRRSNNELNMYNSNKDRTHLRLSLIDNGDHDDLLLRDDDDLEENGDGDQAEGDERHQLEKYVMYMSGNQRSNHLGEQHQQHRYDCQCYTCQQQNVVGKVGGNGGGGGGGSAAWWANSIQQQMQPSATSPTHSDGNYAEMNVVLHRQENGFGFRIVGGIEDRSQVAVGHIVPGGSADLDGRIQSGDEILSVDGYSVLKASHRQVVQLMNVAATRGQVVLVLRRRNGVGNTRRNMIGSHHDIIASPGNNLVTTALHLSPPYMNQSPHEYSVQSPVMPPPPPPPVVSLAQLSPQLNNNTVSNTVSALATYDVTVTRTENEGFGFVIISSVNKIGSTIGRLIEDSPAERCLRLRVGDYIVAVNHIDIMQLTHGDIVNLIKESGLSVTLTISANAE